MRKIRPAFLVVSLWLPAGAAEQGQAPQPPPFGARIRLGVPQTGRGHYAVMDLSFSPDGKTVWVLSSEGRAGLEALRSWDEATGALRWKADAVTAFAGSPDGRVVSVGRSRGVVHQLVQLDSATGKDLLPAEKVPRSFKSLPGDINVMAYTPDGKRLLMDAGGEAKIYLRDIQSGKELHSLASAPRVEKRFVAFSPDGKTVALGGNRVIAELFDVTTGKKTVELTGLPGNVTVAFSGDGKRLLTGGSDAAQRVWDVAKGKEVSRLPGQYVGVISPDGEKVVTCGIDDTLNVWGAATGQRLARKPVPKLSMMPLAFSPDGARVAGGMDDGTVLVWDVSSLTTSK